MDGAHPRRLLGWIIRRVTKNIRHPKKQDTPEIAAALLIDTYFLSGWAGVLREALRPGERAKLEADIRGAIVCAYKEGYRRGRKRRRKS
jgi:hypothetical protein